MKKKRLTSLVMAAVLSAASVTPAVANTVTNNATAVGADSYDIGVTSMKIQALGDWEIVSTGTPLTSLTQMIFSIGGCEMPAVAKADGVKEVPLSGAFVDAGKPKAIAPGASLSGDPKGLKLLGAIKGDTRSDKKAAAQFKITYTVAALSGTGEALGSVYVGDDKTAAGFQNP